MRRPIKNNSSTSVKRTRLSHPKIVYVVGAGFSAGLNFPTISNLLQRIWSRVEAAGFSDDLAAVIRFHHPSFNPTLPETFPNIEQLLSELQANAQLFASSRPATGKFRSEDLEETQWKLLLELTKWFHELQRDALRTTPAWLQVLVEKMKVEHAQIISFNWDLVLDQLLFGSELKRSSYGFGKYTSGPRLIKPHGSLNWYHSETGKFLKDDSKFLLTGVSVDRIFAFRHFRSPVSSRREYMPLIVPPVYMKQFQGDLFRHLWQETVSVISTASEVRFLGYSLPSADFHARFILRCGFHNQEEGALLANGERANATGRAKVTVVDPDNGGGVNARISDAVGWSCDHRVATIEEWMTT